MELPDKDKATVTALQSLDDTTPNAISFAARILGRATRVVVEDVKKPLKAPKKIKTALAKRKLVTVSPEKTARELGKEEGIIGVIFRKSQNRNTMKALSFVFVAFLF